MGGGICNVEGEVNTGPDVSEDIEGSLHFFDASNENTVVRIPAVEVHVASCFDIEHERLKNK